MKCRHIFEKRIYLISNRAVAGNALFTSENDQAEFLGKVEQYLSPICDVLAYSLHDDQFQLLIETKSRKHFTSFFKLTHKGNTDEEFFLPLSTHIFSRQMSNLQVSVAKKFNFRNDRSGALFAARFERILVEDENGATEWAKKLNTKKRYFNAAEKWENQIMGKSGEELVAVGSRGVFDLKFGMNVQIGNEGNVGGMELGGFVNSNLGEFFNGLLESDHLHPMLRKMMIEHRINFPCGPNRN